MSFKDRSTVTYQVWSLDVWGDDGEWTVNDRSNIGAVSVRTDHQSKDGRWSVSNRALVRALIEGHYLKAGTRSRSLDIDGEDDGVLNIDDAKDGFPTLQLEYESAHSLDEKRGLFGEPKPRARDAKTNPISNFSTLETAALVVGGVAVVGTVGWFVYQYVQKQQAQLASTQQPQQPPQLTGPAAPTMQPLTGVPDTTGGDQVPPFVPGFTPGV